ncbi:helix-turn-helix transcriptional regulator [Brevibacillus agri]|uniref:helix-turn-helix domain-containing protein n=1 Tax=Brevibacillus agri TaxID=51101 RepID=UPI00055C59D7|nr:helix-turn-helix transcriptional regulator [Brevibacillus agri]WHX32884.1 helix-turn-helix transcriptional regulator [Brevibacillus agri]
MQTIKLKLKLDEVLKERGISQNKLSKMIGVRQATISDLCRNARSDFSIPIIEKIAQVLQITNITELMQFEVVSEENELIKDNDRL